MSKALYDDDFYAQQAAHSLIGARAVLGLLFEHFKPASMLDLGCGVGTWVRAAQDLGVADALGLDGGWVRPEQLVVPAESFRAVDFTAPTFEIGRSADLGISMEVLEHLPAAAADRAARLLARAAPVVLFSAAIPGQPGTDHINLRWQSYWAGIFAQEGHVATDGMRRLVWGRDDVPYWYQQNVVLYARPERMRELGFAPVEPRSLDVVHPLLFGDYVAWKEKRYKKRFSYRWKALRGRARAVWQ